MLKQKNKLMLIYSALCIGVSILFHLLNRVFDVMHYLMMGDHMMFSGTGYNITLNVLFAVPIILVSVAFIFYMKNKEHSAIPPLVTASLTFSSISIIAGGGGMVELHFSIFMMVAIIAYYEQIKLISLSTFIFAVQHILGLIWFPQVVFGANSYTFGMFLLHALFLVLTSLATISQIYQKQKVLGAIEAVKQEKEETIQRLLVDLENLSSTLNHSTTQMKTQSEQHVRTSNEMLQSFQEVTSGLEKQNESISNVNVDIGTVKNLVDENTDAFKLLHNRTQTTTEIMSTSFEAMNTLHTQIELVAQSMQQTTVSTQSLYEATSQIEMAMELIGKISVQTKLLALNASIEASRAGEQGKGFAVVAHEIRQLADQSKHATEDIQQVLSTIVAETKRTMDNIEVGEQGTQQTVILAKQTVDNYVHMKQDNEEMQTIIEDLYSSAQVLQEKSEHIYAEVLSMSALTEQGVASVEQLLASTEYQQKVTSHIHAEIESTSQLAQRLQQQFK